MKQIITKGGKDFCETSEPYPKETVKQMKQAGYKIKEVEELKNDSSNNN